MWDPKYNFTIFDNLRNECLWIKNFIRYEIVFNLTFVWHNESSSLRILILLTVEILAVKITSLISSLAVTTDLISTSHGFEMQRES